MGGKIMTGIYHINYTDMKYMIGSGLSTENMGMVFKNIEYMNGGRFENLSGTQKYRKRPPPGSIMKN
jgi:hypothetical protein